MTTDLQRQPTPPTNQPPAPPPPETKLDLSLSKIVGGALAAMTAAALGSRLSVAGTIIGAALASIIAAVAGSLYTASLKRTQDKVRTVWTGRTAGGTQPTTVETAVDGGRTPEVSWAPVAPSVTPAANKPTGRSRGSSWKGIVAAALAAFGIAAVSLTGYELVSGHALSGGTGTTITQASEPRATQSPTPAKASPSATPEKSASEQPSTQPSSEPSTAPTSQPSASSEPSAPSTPTSSASAPTPDPSLTARGESSP